VSSTICTCKKIEKINNNFADYFPKVLMGQFSREIRPAETKRSVYSKISFEIWIFFFSSHFLVICLTRFGIERRHTSKQLNESGEKHEDSNKCDSEKWIQIESELIAMCAKINCLLESESSKSSNNFLLLLFFFLIIRSNRIDYGRGE